MPTDTTEKGLETLIMRHMTGEDGFFPEGGSSIEETADEIAAGKAGGNGWITSRPDDFDRAHAIDVAIFDDLLNDEDEDDIQSDANGSAKVALLGMERSLGAWAVLHQELPEEQDVILDFLVLLQKIRRLVLVAFPNAMAFRRVGFDD